MTSSSSEHPDNSQAKADLDPSRSDKGPSDSDARSLSSTAELTPPPDLDAAAERDSSSPEVIEESPASDQTQAPDEKSAAARRRRIKIGSQRDQPTKQASAQRVKPKPKPLRKHRSKPQAASGKAKPAADEPTQKTTADDAAAEKSESPRPAQSAPSETSAPKQKLPPAKIEPSMTPELERQLETEMDGVSIDALMDSSQSTAPADQELEPKSRHTGRVVSVHRENVFIELPAQHQGILPVKQFKDPPETGSEVEVVVRRFDSDEGLYELTRPGVAVDVGDWSAVSEGLILEVVVSGHNKGGLECQLHGLRGFIPASQIDMYRVEDFEQFQGQRVRCRVTEVNPRRRRLILSRRSVLEQERAEARKQLLEELAPGQIREGIVRSLQDFGAFIDLGGVDGLVHISQLSWTRVNHPSDVLEQGQTIKAKVLKVDKESGKVSLGMKDLLENPWALAVTNYPAKTDVKGKITKLTEYGAFMQLEPGVEGLIHISELAYHRVARVADILTEGQEVEAQVLSVDPDKQRIALSIKALTPPPEKPQSRQRAGGPVENVKRPRKKASDAKLRGGVGGGKSDGSQFGLRW